VVKVESYLDLWSEQAAHVTEVLTGLTILVVLRDDVVGLNAGKLILVMGIR
jgi:hypothetical protein